MDAPARCDLWVPAFAGTTGGYSVDWIEDRNA